MSTIEVCMFLLGAGLAYVVEACIQVFLSNKETSQAEKKRIIFTGTIGIVLVVLASCILSTCRTDQAKKPVSETTMYPLNHPVAFGFPMPSKFKE